MCIRNPRFRVIHFTWNIVSFYKGRHKMELKKRYTSFVNGEFIEETGDEYTRADCSPSSGEELATLVHSDAKVLNESVDAARAAFESWGNSAREERSRILNKMADIIDDNKDYLASIEARDVGKPIGEATLQMGLCSSMYRYFAASILSQDEAMFVHDNGSISAILREPLGVVGLILPWNAPAMLLSWKAAPALAAGNTVIVKPSGESPLVVLELARLWADVIPAGVFNVLVGSGSGIGEAMLHHPGINKFSFTGSTEIGKHVGEVTGGNVVPCTLELGGKSANIIFADAQLDRALQFSMLAILSTAGEVCVGGSRLLVQDEIYDEFVGKLVAKFEGLRVGSPLDPEMQVGPVISEAQMNKVLNYIEIGKNEGAKLLCGGYRLTGGEYDNGWYIQPTIFEATNDMCIAREEIFGPVLTVIRFKTEEEAVAIANDSDYGLGAALWTRDMSRSIRVGRALAAGTVWVNDYLTSTPGNPFGGYKKSGIGREIHKIALSYYTNVKNLCFCPDESVPPLF